MRRSSKAILREHRDVPASFGARLVVWLVIAMIPLSLVIILQVSTRSWPVTLTVIGLLAGFVCRACYVRRLRTAERMRERAGESICGFARTLKREAGFDPVVVRAVYEVTQEYAGGPRLPLRAADRIVEDLDLDAETTDEIIMEVADLSRRSLKAAEQNPFFGKVTTLRDVVCFVFAQPRLG